MTTRKVHLLYTVSLLVLFAHCSKDPAIIITSPSMKATVYGEVEPSTPSATITIIRDGDTLATTHSDTRDGSFFFRNIPYDIYTLSASNGIANKAMSLRVDQSMSYVNEIWLYPATGFIQQMTYSDGDTIHPDSGLGDSLSEICFYIASAMDAEFTDTPFRIDPPSLGARITLYEKSNKGIRIQAPKAALFKAGLMAITLYAWSMETTGYRRADSVLIHYTVDTTNQRRIITRMLLTGFSPAFYTGVFREDSLIVRFARNMNRDSVEKSITISPAIPKTFTWDNNSLTITPSNALTGNTQYTVSIGTGAMTVDSIHFGFPFEFYFTTGDRDLFSSTWPSDSAVDIPVNVPFQFNSPYSIEPELVQNAFSIVPPVDSLEFHMDVAGKVTISHAPLIADTTYLITVSGTCQSRKGVRLGPDLNLTFHTVTAH